MLEKSMRSVDEKGASPLTDEQRQLLRAYGVPDYFHDKSILDYPIKDWFHTPNGNLFLEGNKDLIIYGGRTAKIIGMLIARWFILADSAAAVLTLDELLRDILTKTMVIGDHDDILINQRSIFVPNFQTEFGRHLDTDDIIRICNHIENRYYDDRYSQTILHVSTHLNWYPRDFIQFIDDCYLRVEIDQGIRPIKSGN